MTQALRVLVEGLAPAVVRNILEASEQMSLSVDPQAGQDVAALVAGLPSGERSIPIEAAETLAGLDSSVPLLLLSSDELVRSHVVLDGGRVHLIAPPHDVSGLKSRIEHVVHGRPPTSDLAVSHERTGCGVVERWSKDYWMCVFSANDATKPDPVGNMVLAEKRRDGGFCAFPSDNTRTDPAATDALVGQVERLMLGDDRCLGQWVADLSSLASVIAFDTESQELVASLPPSDICAAFLLSPHRLPHVSQLQVGKPVRMSANHGDILLAVIGEESGKILSAEVVRSFVQTGAVVGARALQASLDSGDGRHALMVLEAR